MKSSRFVGVFLRQCTNSRAFVVLPGYEFYCNRTVEMSNLLFFYI